jgi:NAD(P)-dependent dehydrogenase (short-subunit alcohol dehydrogenase family)
MSRPAGKVAIVTGGASGIGSATVLRFLADGARVKGRELAGKYGRFHRASGRIERDAAVD